MHVQIHLFHPLIDPVSFNPSQPPSYGELSCPNCPVNIANITTEQLVDTRMPALDNL